MQTIRQLQKARKSRILQQLSPYLHFVESSNLYSAGDLVEIATGDIVRQLQTTVELFRQHITQTCPTCVGNGHTCELCADKKVTNSRRRRRHAASTTLLAPTAFDRLQIIFPFNEQISICSNCCAVFHRACFQRSSRRCPRCARRRSRHSLSLVANTIDTT